MSWITAIGSWFNEAGNSIASAPFGREVETFPSSRSPEPKKERKYHYSFNIEDKGVDISGFIVHTAKKNQGRHKLGFILIQITTVDLTRMTRSMDTLV